MIVVLLIMLSLLLMSHELIGDFGTTQLSTLLRVTLGFLAGIAIGAISSLLGVAGGELIIPTIILLFAMDIKLAGSLSLAISVPTILMGLYKYRRQQQLANVFVDRPFITRMALGSVLGSLVGSYFAPIRPRPLFAFSLGLHSAHLGDQNGTPRARESERN